PGCLRVELFRSVAGPQCFYIHSEWVDQAAFDTHAKMPHMTRFLGLLGELASNAVEAVRTERIG
ncbi:MAG TPA: hypothetical protein DEH78_09775, partial [Solibacterales bacterium]|nr:hypothetical protein [Bryobacterales bacterium]